MSEEPPNCKKKERECELDIHECELDIHDIHDRKFWLEKIAKLTNKVGLQKIIKQRTLGCKKDRSQGKHCGVDNENDN